jgi:hypothetical protein
MPLRSGGISHASSGGKISWLGRKPAPLKRTEGATRQEAFSSPKEKRAVQSGSSFDQFRPRHRVHSVANVQALQLGDVGCDAPCFVAQLGDGQRGKACTTPLAKFRLFPRSN